MSVKDILQSLVDDNLVDSDRIGTSNYFWAFPSKAINNNTKRQKELEGKLEEVRRKKVHFSEQLAQAMVGREETEKRSSVLVDLENRHAERSKLSKELEQYKSCDPQRLEELCEF